MQLAQLMLYVENQKEIRDFWVKHFDFVVKNEVMNGDMYMIELSPHANAETTIILHNREQIMKMSPELDMTTPSLLFATSDLEKLHARLVAANVTVGEIVDMPGYRVFNFADPENHYFAVKQA
ncbi:VOC family protein [Kurthia sp. Dielmo]|uniref:VOC family protein n=1 Tax=Kurthia sp. Dielmo TaxID=1033738 RepID=UPI0035150323